MTFRNSTLRTLYPQQDDFILAIEEMRSDPRQICLAFSQAAAATGVLSWAPGQKAKITKIELVNGDVAIAASSTTTVLDIDVEDGIGGKEHDIAAKLVGVAVPADAKLALTLSTTDDDLVVEATELVKCARTIANTQGEMSLVISYQYID